MFTPSIDASTTNCVIPLVLSIAIGEEVLREVCTRFWFLQKNKTLVFITTEYLEVFRASQHFPGCAIDSTIMLQNSGCKVQGLSKIETSSFIMDAHLQHRFGYQYPGGEKPFVMNQTRWTNSANRAFVPTPTLVQSCTAADGAMGLRIMVSDSDPDEDVPHQEHVQPHPSTVYSNPASVVTPLVPPDNTPEDSVPSIAATELPPLSYKDSIVEDEYINRTFAFEWSQSDEEVTSEMNHVGARKRFPQLLFRMMEDIDKRECHLSHIVSWHHSGLHFLIHKPDAFVSHVLPLYFRGQSKLASFRRQLKNYGFLHRYQLRAKKDDRLMYYHQNFQRDKPLLVPYVVLKSPKTSKNTALSLSIEALLEMKQVKKASPRATLSDTLQQMIKKTSPTPYSLPQEPAPENKTAPAPASRNSRDNLTLHNPLATFSGLEAARVNCFESNTRAKTSPRLLACPTPYSLPQEPAPENKAALANLNSMDTIALLNPLATEIFSRLEAARINCLESNSRAKTSPSLIACPATYSLPQEPAPENKTAPASLSSMDNMTLFNPLATEIFSRLGAARVNCFESNSRAKTSPRLIACPTPYSLPQELAPENKPAPASLSTDNMTLFNPLATEIFSRLEAARVNYVESNSTATVGQLFAPLQQQRPTEEDTCPQSGVETDDLENRNIFPRRLYRMLEDIHIYKSHLNHIISWHSCGLNFVIHKPDAFVSEILPLYFQGQTKLASFQRQLKNYGFQRYRQGYNSTNMLYYHEHFRKDKPSMLSQVILKSSKVGMVR
jgi:hypothetical protein